MSEEKPYGIHIVGGDIFINDKWIRVYDYVQDLQSQLADAKAEVERLREELNAAKKDVENANRGAETNAHINRSFASQIITLKATIAQLTVERDDAMSAATAMSNDVTHFGEQNEALQSTIAQQSAKIDALREALVKAGENFNGASVVSCDCGSISSEHGCNFCDSFERVGRWIDFGLAALPPKADESKGEEGK